MKKYLLYWFYSICFLIILISFNSQSGYAQKKNSRIKSGRKISSQISKPRLQKNNLKSDWHTIFDKTGKFSFKFPRKVKILENSVSISNGRKINLRQYGSSDDGQYFLVTYYEKLNSGLSGEDAGMENYQAALLYAGAGETIVSDKYLGFIDVEKKYKGNEIITRSTDGTTRRFRMLFDKKDSVLMVTTFPTNSEKEENYLLAADIFFDSFPLAKNDERISDLKNLRKNKPEDIVRTVRGMTAEEVKESEIAEKSKVKTSVCAAALEKYVSEKDGFTICFPKTSTNKNSKPKLKIADGVMETKIGSLSDQEVDIDVGGDLYAVTIINLPEDYPNQETGTAISDLGLEVSKKSDENVYDEDGNQLGVWFKSKGCVKFFDSNSICINQNFFVDHKKLYRLTFSRDKVGKLSSNKQDFENQSQLFFDSFRLLRTKAESGNQ